MCIEEESTLTLLTDLVDELQRRKALLAASGQPNIDCYNEATEEDLPRYIFACDEIAEVLDKTGLTKEQKEIVGTKKLVKRKEFEQFISQKLII